MTISSFPPLVCATSRVLILGTLPGAKSLASGEYYSHPQNSFWRVMAAVLDAPMPEAYSDRTALLLENGIAIWDVFSSARRIGSLDANIEDPQPNDFCQFFEAYPTIRIIGFNGGLAARSYKKVAHRALDRCGSLTHILLPSTSPANTVGLADKVAQWSVLRSHLA